jgi:hypothetical protein
VRLNTKGCRHLSEKHNVKHLGVGVERTRYGVLKMKNMQKNEEHPKKFLEDSKVLVDKKGPS